MRECLTHRVSAFTGWLPRTRHLPVPPCSSSSSSAKRLEQTSANKGSSDEIAVGSELGGRNFFLSAEIGRMRNKQAFKMHATSIITMITEEVIEDQEGR